MSTQPQSQPERSQSYSKLVHTAERELGGALLEHERPIAGMYVGSSRDADAALERAVRVVCDEARLLDLRAEEMLIAVKHAWSQLAPTRVRQLGERDGDVLRNVVRTSIEVFFEPLESRARDQR